MKKWSVSRWVGEETRCEVRMWADADRAGVGREVGAVAMVAAVALAVVVVVAVVKVGQSASASCRYRVRRESCIYCLFRSLFQYVMGERGYGAWHQ